MWNKRSDSVRRICLVCGNEDESKMVSNYEKGYDQCTCCGETLIDIIDDNPQVLLELESAKLLLELETNIF